nr:spermidine synthase [Actinomycetes bacterium]
MSAHFEELGWRQTPIGMISLRRRFDLSVRADVYEVKLGDEYLMSSLFTVAERELARLALARTPGSDLDVIVGGLGLGYTAQEALKCNRIHTL